MNHILTRACILACVVAGLALGALAGLGGLQAAEAVIGLIDTPEKAKEAQAAWAAKLGKPAQWANSAGMKFQFIPPGEFEMGAQDGDADAKPHKVRLTEPFYIGTYEVTREEWKAITKLEHSRYFPGPRHPMTYVNWYDTEAFFAALNKAEGLTNAVAKCRLPTEAEWEFAARAGTKTRYYSGDSEADLDKAGWHEKNGGGAPHPVGQKLPNAFGLYDMLGNVWEWCGDAYDPDYYSKSPAENPPGPKVEYPYEYTVLRGGACLFGPTFCTVWHRDHSEAERTFKHVGLRVMQPIKP
ncbi:MAG: SUMF1/EgtB/PvdO family nonheme iron enzyme [Verrucomicrobia bacterium]|nr:SUMF1/EgtB/PvdO family nonheme iron enzyme [Verrucomicrobiota bacterium]